VRAGDLVADKVANLDDVTSNVVLEDALGLWERNTHTHTHTHTDRD
jgi:hypothetical protein